MRKQGACKCILAAGALAATLGVAQADETGIAGIHGWVKTGRKTCLADHFHSGSSTGATRKVAERQAIQSWVDFTSWEYGTSWGRYSNAANKKVTCERSGSWRCFVEARPCRPF